MKQLVISLLTGMVCLPVMAEDDPPEIALGERLFLETRFAQAYAKNLDQPDTVDAKTLAASRAADAPFTGKTMSCRACHLVDEHKDKQDAGMRSYADFARRPPVPSRNDGITHAARHSQQLVNIHVNEKKQVLFHFDGEFASLPDLVMGTYTGRNFGWLPGEEEQAMKHIVSVIRNDNGEDEFGREFGGSYTELLADRKLPASYRIDARTASDSELFGAIARLVALYVSDLGLSRNDRGEYNGSPYDIFLALNKLPRMPADGESDLDYSRRLLKAVNNLDKPVFVTNRHGKFKTHDQPFLFAEQELAGMKIFFTGPGQDSRATSGNCIACHAAPHFSDFNFHNTGVSQAEYDDIHGAGQFMKLPVPNARQRSKNPDATGRFRSIPARNRPELADLGAWNIVLNKNMPKPQKKLRKLLCTDNINCDDDVLLNNALAAFKTPVIRDLEHSWPYLHNGSAKTIESVLNHYIESTARAKNATLRNPAKQLKNISIGPADIAPLAAFIRALNEDYE